MNYEKLLAIADCQDPAVPGILAGARAAAKGTTWRKWYTRLFKAGKLAKVVCDNNATRASAVDPKYADDDVEHVSNINAYGDNDNWDEATGLPKDRNVRAAEPTQFDIDRNYWAKGLWAGDYAAVKAWYRRNGGAGLVYRLGAPVARSDARARYVGQSGRWTVEVLTRGPAALLVASYRLAFGFSLKVRSGYEIDNVFDHNTNTQNWYPLPGYSLNAPVTHTILPTKE